MRREISEAARKMGVLGAIALAAGCGSASSSGASGGSSGSNVSGSSAGGSDIAGGGATSDQTGAQDMAGARDSAAGSAGADEPAGGAGGATATGALSCRANFTIHNVAFYGDTGVMSPELTSCPGATPPVAAITGNNVTTTDTGVILYGTPPYFWAAYAGQQAGQIPVTLSVDTAGALTVRSSLYSADGSYAYAAAGFVFASASCLNASQYTGVRFEVTGSLGNCSVLFQVNDSEDSAAATSSGRGECQTAKCIGPYFQVTKPGIYDAPFSTLSGGAPKPGADVTSIIGMQWLLSVGQ